MPPTNEILYYNLPPSEQYWRREPLPKWYIEKAEAEAGVRAEERKQVELKKKQKVTYVDPQCERYRRREWHRRIYGLWFFNDGVPTYITGNHYYYLQWCKYDHLENDGYPLYYEHSRDSFYFRQVCEEDPKCLGYMIIGPRGTGKTNEELACIMNTATRIKNSRVALQSKTFEDDSKKVLIKAKMVPLFNHLPDFFKPIFSHPSNPEERLVFTRKSVVGKDAAKVKFDAESELNSFIFAALPGVKALDTETLREVFEDEIGKTHAKKQADIHKRHKTNVKCVFRNHRKIGLLRKTSTVEEMNEGGAECFKLWKESDYKKRDGNGQTISKIYRRLISALDTDTSPEACDKHGRVNRQIANDKIERELSAVIDRKERSSILRKNPRNEQEAFIPDQSKSVLNIENIVNRLHTIREVMTKPPYVTGNLYWTGVPFKSPVNFKPDPKAGRFNFAWFPDEFTGLKNPDQWKILNNVGQEMGYDINGDHRILYYPKNGHMIRIATDPIKFVKTKDPRASKAAAHAFRMYDINVDYVNKPKENWITHNFFVEYIVRPEDPAIYLDDMVLLCMFLGAPMLPERNVPTVNQHFVACGMEKFLTYPGDFKGLMLNRNSDDAGFATTPEVIDAFIRRLITFTNEHCHRMPFDNTLEDWRDCDISNLRAHDPTVSSGFVLLHSERQVDNDDEKPKENVGEFFDIYDNEGMNARELEDDEVEGIMGDHSIVT